VSLYNPLARGSVLYETWRGLGDSSRLAKWPDARLVERYVEHLAGAFPDGGKRETLDAFVDESRSIVRDLHALLDVIKLSSPFDEVLSKSGIQVYFPVISQFDARAVEANDHRGVFISSRYLDGIDFFANIVGAWSLLNSQLSERALTPTELTTPYAWIPFLVNQQCIDLEYVSEEYKDYHNNLTEFFLRGMSTIVEMPSYETTRFLDARYQQVAAEPGKSIEPRYLAAVTLLYVYLHECAHILLAHNELTPPQLSPIQRIIRDSITKSIEEANEAAGETVAQRLWDSESSLQFSLEMAADFQSVLSTVGEYGDPVLEAASLWLTTLGTCRIGGRDLFDTFKQSTGDEHPPYPTRVWALNGALGSYSRQGHVARSVCRAAEQMAGAAVPFRPELRRTRTAAYWSRWKELLRPLVR
jgi:hypothetical protein